MMSRNFVRRPTAWKMMQEAPRLPVLRNSTSPFSQLTARNAVRYCRPDTSCSLSLLQRRSYSAPGEEPPREDSNPPASFSQPDATWVTILESTAHAPFLKQRLPDPEGTLRRAFTLFYQVILSLTTVGNPEAASHILLAFKTAPVSPTSDIGRARRAIAIIIFTIVDDISSIPLSAPVRAKHPEIFSIHGALVPLSALHLGDPNGEVEDWREFWTRAEPILLELDGKLYDAGFGADVDEIVKEQSQKEKKEDR